MEPEWGEKEEEIILEYLLYFVVTVITISCHQERSERRMVPLVSVCLYIKQEAMAHYLRLAYLSLAQKGEIACKGHLSISDLFENVKCLLLTFSIFMLNKNGCSSFICNQLSQRMKCLFF